LRIVIAATQRVFASALGSLLRRAGHDVAGYAIDLGAAPDIIVREHANACVVDADMPWEPGAISLAMAVCPGTAFVVLADAPGSAGLSRALSAGVHGAVLKSDEFVEFLRVLTGACARVTRRPVGGAVVSMSVQAGRRTIRAGRHDPEMARSLTPREREVLARLVQGESTSTMARSMGVRLSTTRTHVDSVLIKLGVHSRLEAVALAVREGIVDVTVSGTGRDRASGRPALGNANQAAHRRLPPGLFPGLGGAFRW
jgi:two-component system nitrate/nitrite response regulator NarL